MHQVFTHWHLGAYPCHWYMYFALCPLPTAVCRALWSLSHAWAVVGGGHVVKACCRHCYRVSPGRLDLMQPCLEWLGAGIGAVTGRRNGQSAWGTQSNLKILPASVGWLACLWPQSTHGSCSYCSLPLERPLATAVWCVQGH